MAVVHKFDYINTVLLLTNIVNYTVFGIHTFGQIPPLMVEIEGNQSEKHVGQV